MIDGWDFGGLEVRGFRTEILSVYISSIRTASHVFAMKSIGWFFCYSVLGLEEVLLSAFISF